MASGDSERGRRIRVGMTGLAAVLVIVAAVAAVFDSTRDSREAANAVATEMANAAEPKEPLAEIGVVPPSDAGLSNETLEIVPERQPPVIEPTPPPRPIE